MKHTYRFPDGEKVSWTGSRPCLCTDCRRLFGGVTAFDMHRRNFHCRRPPSVGLVSNDKGHWGQPAPEMLRKAS